jgi:hypothetical protein
LTNGRIHFSDSADASETKEALISVKGGGRTYTRAGMNRNWLTTHWPLLRGQPHVYYVYVQHCHEKIARLLTAGDHVLFYELRTGPSRLLPGPEGATTLLKRERGRRGIVATGVVSGSYRPFSWPKEALQQYEGRPEMHWAWEVPVEHHDLEGFAPHADVMRVLRYEPRYPMRGFGIQGSGVKEMTGAQFQALMSSFKGN